MTIGNNAYHITNENGIITANPPLDVPKIKGMGSTLYQKMSERQDLIAQIDAKTGEKQTWGHVLKNAVRTAIAMRSKGVTQEDIISNCSLMHLDSCVPILASFFLGAKVANFDPSLAPSDMIQLVKQVPPKMIFVDPEGVELIENVLEGTNVCAQIVVFGESTKHLQFSEFLKPSPAEIDFRPVEVQNPKETTAILFSSGTTGLAKGICLSHYALLGPKLADSNFNAFFGVTYLSLAQSYYWISSLVTLYVSALFGVIRVIHPKFDVTTTWELIATYKPSLMYLAPNQVIALCKNAKPKVDVSSVKHVLIGGGHISIEQISEARELLKSATVANCYGSTELASNGFWWPLDTDKLTMNNKPNSVGKPMRGFQYKIVDTETEEVLGPNQTGELRVKTDFVMSGYYKRDSSSDWDADGFLKTGDIGYYDEDYCFYIVDRIKEMLKYRTWHVFPVKLEAIMLTHPAVAACVVFGMPHPEDGDYPTSLVVLKSSSAKSTTARDLEKYIEESVEERQWLRGGVKIVTSIPTNVNGKYNRRRIKQMVLAKEIC